MRGVFTREERERHLKNEDVHLDDHSKTLVKIAGLGTGLTIGYFILREAYNFTVDYFTRHPEIYDFCDYFYQKLSDNPFI